MFVTVRALGRCITLWIVSTCLHTSRSRIECVRSCDQKLYLHNETKGGICIEIEFNPQRLFGSFNMAAVSLFTPPTWPL